MKRVLLYVVLPLAIAAASIANIVLFRMGNLLRPSWPQQTMAAMYVSAVAIAVLALVAIFASRWRLRAWVLAACLILIVALAFVPHVVDVYVVSQQQAELQAEGADVEMQFQSDYLDRSDDVESRIEAGHPYTPGEALAFLDFAAGSDLSWRSLPDHTPETFALLERAIQGGILDPNAVTTTTPTADSPAVTLTVAFYDKNIRPSSPRAIEKHAWDVLQILVAHGADLSSADASQVRADLAKTVILGKGRYLELK